jgi:hypothetical protein
MIVAITSVKKWAAICVFLIAFCGDLSATGQSNNDNKYSKDRRRTQGFFYPVPSPTYRTPFPTLRPPTEWPTKLPPNPTVHPTLNPTLNPTSNPPPPKAYIEDPYSEDPYHDDPYYEHGLPFLTPRAALDPSAEPSTGTSIGPSPSPTATPINIVTVRKYHNIHIYSHLLLFLYTIDQSIIT